MYFFIAHTLGVNSILVHIMYNYELNVYKLDPKL